MKELIFSKWYSKLNNELFITLRKRKQCDIGEHVQVTIKGMDKTLFAKCLEIIPRDLDHYSDELLIFDTDTNTREEAIELLQSFYRTPILPDTRLYLHVFSRKLNGVE